MAMPGSPITRNHIPSTWEYGLRDVIFDEYEYRVRQSETIFSDRDEKKRQVTDAVFAGTGVFHRADEGEAPFVDSIAEAYTVQKIHSIFKLAISITREAMADDLYGPTQQLAKEAGYSAWYTKAVESMSFFNNPTGETIYTMDGTSYPLLSTAHGLKNGSTFSNRPSAAASLAIDTLESGLNDYRTNFVDHRGRKVMIQPRWLMVPPGLQYVAQRLLMSNFRPGGDANDVNAVKQMHPGLEPLVMDHLTNNGCWFLVAEKRDQKLNYNNREDLDVTRETDGTGSGNLLLVAYFRCSWGASQPHGVYGSPSG